MSQSTIDPEWLQRELTRVIKNLIEEHPAVAAETVEGAVRTAAEELVATARIAKYLPVLIRRGAKARLQAIDFEQVTSLSRR